jgi:hypothetical protein
VGPAAEALRSVSLSVTIFGTLSTAASRTLLGAALLLTSACATDGAGTESPDAGALRDVSDVSLATNAMQWRLAWETEAIDFEEVGWSTVTDLGVRVHVTSGELTNYSGQLVECETARAEPTWRTRVAALDVARLWRGVAWAGHSSDQLNSTTTAGLLEDVALLANTEWAGVETEAVDYCRVHYLVARADDEVVGWLEDSAMDRITFTLRGTWSAPGGEPTAFLLSTSSANGRLFDVSAIGGASGPLQTEVTRTPARWFDGVAWTASHEDVSRVVLANMLSSATATVSPL